MQLWKVKIGPLEDFQDSMLPLYSVPRNLFCPLRRRELEILVNGCLSSLALNYLISNLCCLLTSHRQLLSRTGFSESFPVCDYSSWYSALCFNFTGPVFHAGSPGAICFTIVLWDLGIPGVLAFRQ